jgi:dienelactone hydrolase
MMLRSLLVLVSLLAQTAFAQQTQEVQVPSLDSGVMLTGWWTPATQTTQKQVMPAMVALHGCSGLTKDKQLISWPHGHYVKLLQELGVGILYLDSFGPRGVESICSEPRRLRKVDEKIRRLDVYGALTWLAKQPGVDAQRLGVIGWSHGGQTVLSVADQTDDLVKNARIKPSVLVAFYPSCTGPQALFRYETIAPLLIMTGALDNWTPPAPCRRLTERLQQTPAGPSVRYIEYPDSYHAFDSTRPPRVRDNVAGTKSGTATVGGNPAARTASAKELTEFLTVQFQLEKRQP